MVSNLFHRQVHLLISGQVTLSSFKGLNKMKELFLRFCSVYFKSIPMEFKIALSTSIAQSKLNEQGVTCHFLI